MVRALGPQAVSRNCAGLSVAPACSCVVRRCRLTDPRVRELNKAGTELWTGCGVTCWQAGPEAAYLVGRTSEIGAPAANNARDVCEDHTARLRANPEVREPEKVASAMHVRDEWL